MRRLSLPALALLFAFGCEGTAPTDSGNEKTRLAGGGRLESGDTLGAYSDSPGLEFPEIRPNGALTPLFYAFRNCSGDAHRQVISDSIAWNFWWSKMTSCDFSGSGWITPGWPPFDPDDFLFPPDSTEEPSGGYAPKAPTVDFDSFSVIAIAVEHDSGAFCHRAVWITDVEQTQNLTKIQYKVTRLDQSCCGMVPAVFVPRGFSPVVAVRITRQFTERTYWTRSDTMIACPGFGGDQPLALKYVDTQCSLLGDPEHIIRDSVEWKDWLNRLSYCGGGWVGRPGDSTRPFDTGGWIVSEPAAFPIPRPDARSILNVDFSLHSVMILRAGQQDRWGGGIWLDAIERSTSGTVIFYSVMEPSVECPNVNDGGYRPRNPTVAIRLPLPLDPPITWIRHVEAIACGWVTDSVWVDSTGVGGP